MYIFFMRHAQSVGNLTGDYSTTFHGSLSKIGEEQANSATERLKEYTFDQIIVSPYERAMKTILPYLKVQQKTAEIWGELAEACHQSYKEQPAPKNFRYGNHVCLDDSDVDYFRIREDHEGAYLPPDDENYQEGLRRINWVYTEIMHRYKGSDKTILVVGHGHAGSRLLEMFVGMNPSGRIDHVNTGLSMIRELESGEYAIKFINRMHN